MSPDSAQPAEYELVLMLDPETPDERRDAIAGEARQRIEAGGDLKHDTTWGMRKLAYEIRQRTEADYRFFRFETGGSLLDELDHSLKITDGVLRFRIFKVDPRTPVIEPPAPLAFAGAGASRGRGGRREGGPGRGPRAAEGAGAEEGAAPAPAAAATSEPPTEASAEEQPAEAPAEEAPPGEPATEAPAEEPPAEPDRPAE